MCKCPPRADRTPNVALDRATNASRCFASVQPATSPRRSVVRVFSGCQATILPLHHPSPEKERLGERRQDAHLQIFCFSSQEPQSQPRASGTRVSCVVSVAEPWPRQSSTTGGRDARVSNTFCTNHESAMAHKRLSDCCALFRDPCGCPPCRGAVQ